MNPKSMGPEPSLLVSRVEILPFEDVAFIERLRELDLRAVATADAPKGDLITHARLIYQERRFRRRYAAADLSRDMSVTRNSEPINQYKSSSILSIVLPFRRAGETMDNIASTLNRMGLTTPRGTVWRARHISKILAKYE